jgi:DNA-directed RNA polymerase subunit L
MTSNKINISNIDENSGILTFTLSNINVSYANALRRVLLSDIPLVVFKTQPYSENKVNILINKTRMNNELLKQRLSCIPIHIEDIDNFPIEDYQVELDVKNDTNSMIYITSEDFKIKNIQTNTYLKDSEVKTIFPPDQITREYIDIMRLRPKISDTVESEQLKLVATFAISNAGHDGAYNVVSTCAYGNTLDPIKIDENWNIKEASLKEKYSKEEIEFAKKDWMLLDSKRYFVDDSFDFIIESIGIYTNFKLIEMACLIIIKKLYVFLESIKNNSSLIYDAIDTLENCYIITIENEDYTIGKIIEYYLYNNLFIQKKDINYVGFLKKHPHDKNSIIKISYKMQTSKDEIITILEEAVNESIMLLNQIAKYFNND